MEEQHIPKKEQNIPKKEQNIPKMEQPQPKISNFNIGKPKQNTIKTDSSNAQQKPTSNFSIPEGLDFNEITGNFKDTTKQASEPPQKKNEDNFKQKTSKTPIPERTTQQTLNNDFAGLFSNFDFSVGNSQQPEQSKPATKIDPSCKIHIF